MIKRVGVLYHPKRADALAVARQTAEILGRHGVACSLLPAWEEEAIRAALPDWDMVVTCGGDGTILRTTRLAAPLGVPQVGVNLGKLGFLSELQPAEVSERLPAYLSGVYSIEERAMLRATLHVASEAPAQREAGSSEHQFDALNEVLVARGALPRVITVKVAIDGVEYHTFSGDGLIVATATGSTAYSMAASGPVLTPTLRNMILNPVCPHSTRATKLVLPPDACVTVEIVAGSPAILSIDGHVDLALGNGDTIRVGLSPHVAKFIRARPLEHFYGVIGRTLR